jgi:hypothetical protein
MNTIYTTFNDELICSSDKIKESHLIYLLNKYILISLIFALSNISSSLFFFSILFFTWNLKSVYYSLILFFLLLLVIFLLLALFFILLLWFIILTDFWNAYKLIKLHSNLVAYWWCLLNALTYSFLLSIDLLNW